MIRGCLNKRFIHYQFPGNWYEPTGRSPVLLPIFSACYTCREDVRQPETRIAHGGHVFAVSR